MYDRTNLEADGRKSYHAFVELPPSRPVSSAVVSYYVPPTKPPPLHSRTTTDRLEQLMQLAEQPPLPPPQLLFEEHFAFPEFSLPIVQIAPHFWSPTPLSFCFDKFVREMTIIGYILDFTPMLIGRERDK
jgi:hypothetical protein